MGMDHPTNLQVHIDRLQQDLDELRAAVGAQSPRDETSSFTPRQIWEQFATTQQQKTEKLVEAAMVELGLEEVPLLSAAEVREMLAGRLDENELSRTLVAMRDEV